MATQTSPSVLDTTQLRAELRETMEEKSLLDDIEGNLERTRIKEDDERTKKRKQEDAAIVRKREVADEKREARQEELCERETAIRTKLKACKLLGDSPYLTPPAVPSVRSREEFEDANFITPSSDSGIHGTHKRPRTGGAVPTTALPLPPTSDDNNNASLQSKKRVLPQDEIKVGDSDAQPSFTKSLRDIVPLPQLQLLPLADHAAGLPAFAAMPHFSREFLSDYIGGSNPKCGLIPVGKDKKAVQIVECDGYLVLNPSLNPYIPSAPGQHFAFLDLQPSPNVEGDLYRGRSFPVFLSTSKACWYYSGHYAESTIAEKIEEPTQKRLVSEIMLDKLVRSLFEARRELTDFGFEILSNSGLYSHWKEWNTITKEKVKLSLRTKSRNNPYTQIPFWFRFLQCVRFDHSFHDILVAKKLEVAVGVKKEPCGQTTVCEQE